MNTEVIDLTALIRWWWRRWWIPVISAVLATLVVYSQQWLFDPKWTVTQNMILNPPGDHLRELARSADVGVVIPILPPSDLFLRGAMRGVTSALMTAATEEEARVLMVEAIAKTRLMFDDQKALLQPYYVLMFEAGVKPVALDYGASVQLLGSPIAEVSEYDFKRKLIIMLTSFILPTMLFGSLYGAFRLEMIYRDEKER
jgi:hypothetical protein|tara:strand:+ start:507 stop:1106 length:600 start_codon:yes stop_codon:yes gene_type:complete